jgi:hypothetical protein
METGLSPAIFYPFFMKGHFTNDMRSISIYMHTYQI